LGGCFIKYEETEYRGPPAFLSRPTFAYLIASIIHPAVFAESSMERSRFIVTGFPPKFSPSK
jgi:hypothetical protein